MSAAPKFKNNVKISERHGAGDVGLVLRPAGPLQFQPDWTAGRAVTMGEAMATLG